MTTMTESCKQTTDMLVDYVDGQLPPDQARKVADHLSRCPECRGLARALNRSLVATQIVWQETLDKTADLGARPWPQAGQRPWARYAVIAASIAIVAGGIVLWLARSRPIRQDQILSYQIQQEILDCGRAAQLLEATRILAQCEDTAEIVEQQRQYILRNYPQTPAAISLQNQNSL